MSDDTKAMPRPTVTPTVTESHRVPLQAKYLGPTDHRGTRVKVSRLESSFVRSEFGPDKNTVTVGWDYSLSIHENYTAAVAEYLHRAGWEGNWTVALTGDGAVAVYVPN